MAAQSATSFAPSTTEKDEFEMTKPHTPPTSDKSLPHASSDDVEKTGLPGPTEASAAEGQAPKPPAGPPGPPFSVPDGGLTAWLQVAGGWALFFNTWGISNTFGVFQTYYETGALFTASSDNIAWIGSLQGFFLLLVGFVSGPLYDRGYLRTLLVSGTFLTVFGYMMTSLCKTLWQCILAQGVCVGIGGGLLFVPSVALLPTYFRKRLGLAIGLAASGSSTGGVIYPIVFYKLIGQIGFGWTTRVIGFISLATLIVPVLVLKQRIKPAKARALIDKDAFKDVPYMLFCLGCMIGFIGLYVILFYLSYFANSTHIASDKMSFYIVPILNAASVFGRTVPNAISDITGPFNMIGPGAMICGILVFCMLAVVNLGGVITIAILFGFFSGVFIALPPVCFAVLTPDKSKLGTRIGMGFGVIAFATLLGGPGTGGILGNNQADLNWTGAFVYGGVTLLAASVIFYVIRVKKSGFKLAVKI